MRAFIGRTLLPATLSLLIGAAGALANDDELVIAPEQRTSLSLAIYEHDLAQVQDRRMVILTEGLNRVAFVGVSARLKPQTVLVGTGSSEPVRLIEERYASDLITPQALLQAAVGRDIRVAITNRQTGEERIERATLLSASDGVVLRMGDRIETAPPGRLIFDAVPEGLRDRPTLVLVLTSLKSGAAPIAVSYLTGGLGWQANYVAELDAAEDRLTLAARASVTNSSGAAYRNARLTLVAGNPSRVAEVAPATPRMIMAAAADAGGPRPAAAPEPEAIGDLYRYVIDREINLGERESLELTLIEPASVPARKEYRLVDAAPITATSGGLLPLRVDTQLTFENKKSSGLGMPLPRGVARVYQHGLDGNDTFIGEDRMSDTPADRPVKLALGQAFDVTAERRQTSTARPADKSFEASEEIALRNVKDKPVTVTVVENLPGDWRILEESDSHEKTSAATAEWRIEVPAKAERKLTFHVLTRF